MRGLAIAASYCPTALTQDKAGPEIWARPTGLCSRTGLGPRQRMQVRQTVDASLVEFLHKVGRCSIIHWPHVCHDRFGTRTEQGTQAPYRYRYQWQKTGHVPPLQEGVASARGTTRAARKGSICRCCRRATAVEREDGRQELLRGDSPAMSRRRWRVCCPARWGRNEGRPVHLARLIAARSRQITFPVSRPGSSRAEEATY